MKKLFGTDGIRGRVNQHPMTAEIAFRVGKATAAIMQDISPIKEIIVGKDTRFSGDMIEAALTAGICSAGAQATQVGIIPTPGVAYLASSADVCAGIMITASHNPYHDNGIKIFGADGYKINDSIEEEIERMVADGEELSKRTAAEPGRINYHRNHGSNLGQTGSGHRNPGEKYADFLIGGALPKNFSLNGLKVVMDCSNGAAFEIGPQIFTKLGAELHTINCRPDGVNINLNCGSQHPESLIEKVKEVNADIGLAFDGDADRLTAVDENGEVLNGSCILAIFANLYKESSKLTNNIVVSTVMSNLGLSRALDEMGIDHDMTKVGDRFVLEKMIELDAVIGGEDSGHMIFLDLHTSGDGILSAIRLVDAMKTSNKKLSELKNIMTLFPQCLINVDVKSKPEIETLTTVTAAMQRAEEQLKDNGRILVRYSGTQSQLRVMVEGPTEEITNSLCKEIASAVESEIGI